MTTTASIQRVAIFVPCFIDQLYPQTAVNMVKILRKIGLTVDYNPAQTCCGQPAFNAGYWEETKAVAQKFLKDMGDAPLIVCPSASCVGFVRNYYKDLFTKPEEKSLLEGIEQRVVEFTDFFVNTMKAPHLGSKLEGKATYHDSCAALRECKIKEEPRQLIEQIEGLELIELKDNEVCCGFGGTFAVKFEPISVAMAQQKVNHALDTGAQYLISTDLSCLMHIEGYIQKEKLPLKTMHIIDALANF